MEKKIVQIVPILNGIEIEEDRFDFKIRLILERGTEIDRQGGEHAPGERPI